MWRSLAQNDSLATLLARLEGILGPMPPWMVRKGRYSHRFYTRAGILYERAPSVPPPPPPPPRMKIPSPPLLPSPPHACIARRLTLKPAPLIKASESCRYESAAGRGVLCLHPMPCAPEP